GSKVDLRGLNAVVSEPESDLSDVVCCFEHPHRASVPQGVRRNAFLGQRGTSQCCRAHTTFEHVFEARPRHCAAACVQEEFWDSSLAADSKPRTKICPGPLPDRQHSFAPPLSEDSDGRLRLKGDVINSQADKLGDSESRDEAYVQHGSIADS